MYENEQRLEILDKNIDNYKNIWDKINELAFVIEVDGLFEPKCFIDANNKVCSRLGYSKESFIKTAPSNIFTFDKKGNILELYRNLVYKRCDKVELILKSKDEKHIYVEAIMFLFTHNKKKYILIIAIDVTENKRMEKNITGIINGIPDIIKVYNPDYTIAFFNEAGYIFYNKTPQEVKGKMCYEVLNRNQKCIDCSFEEVMKTKQMLTRERYVPELNKFMDICYNPVLDESDDVVFIVERLRDITEKKILDKILKDSKEKYKQILNNSPDAIVIIVDNKIVLANYEACNLIGLNYNEIIDSNVYKHFSKKYIKVLHKRFRNVISQKRIRDTYDYEFDLLNNKKTNLEISCSYIVYDGSSGILATIRDITEMKQELNRAAKLQRNMLQKSFPTEEFVDIVSAYVPANMISGDFYNIYKINENLIIGMVIDVRGKGMSAALHISALDVLFLQEIAISHEPIEIVDSLNKKMVNYYEENYIAVCCFSMDFNKKELKAVGAGMNQFIFQKKDKEVEEKIIEGSFLGMFENSEFLEQIISFESGDKFFFFSDGLDFILDEDKVVQRYMEKVSICKFKEYIDEFLDDTRLEVGKLEDDCTMIAMEIK